MPATEPLQQLVDIAKQLKGAGMGNKSIETALIGTKLPVIMVRSVGIMFGVYDPLTVKNSPDSAYEEPKYQQ